MSTHSETAALWSAMPLAADSTKIAAAGLSVRQRKLLTLLSQPMTVAQLASAIALPIDEVHATLDRFAKLGLASTDYVTPTPFDPMKFRASPASSTAGSTGSSRTLLLGAGLAALVVVAFVVATWALRGNPKTVQMTTTGDSTTSNSVDAASKASSQLTPPNGGTAPPPARPSSPTARSPLASVATSAPVTPPNPARAATQGLAPEAASAIKAGPPAAAAPPSPTLPAATALTAATAALAAAPTSTTTSPVVAGAATAVSPTPTSAPATAPAPATSAPVTLTVPVAIAAATPPAVVAPTLPRAAPVASGIKLVNRVEPQFPRGADDNAGTVRARLQVDARGTVTAVDIVEANPPRVFDRNVRSALQQWRYEPTGEAFSKLAEIIFRR